MVYDHESYKDLLKTTLLARRDQLGKSYTFQNMAHACRVQKTYLSRVFNGEAHLNDDQLYLACDYLGLTEDEAQYTTLLHAHERSCVVRKKAQLRSKIEVVRTKRRQTGSHLRADSLGAIPADFSGYYLEPQMQLVHMFLTIPRFAGDIAKIRHALGLKETELGALLTKLQGIGLIGFREGRYEVLRDAIHLSPDSAVYKAGRAMLRLKAMDRVDRLGPGETYNFSVVFSATDAVRARVQARFLEFLKSIEEDVQGAPAEEVFQLSFDLLNWSK